MKRSSFLLILCLCLSLIAACGKTENTPTDPPVKAPAKPPTEPSTEPSVETGIDPMGLVGTWEFAYTEIEGEIVEDGSATITIYGDDAENLVITYRDHLFPDESFTEKALILDMRPMYYGCGNEEWVMDVDYIGAIGNTHYAITLMEDGTLCIQNRFTIEDMPMVSYQWFTRNE